jgi:superfamily II DNA or RNA helicase
MFDDDETFALDARPAWPHQAYGLAEVWRLIAAGCRRVLVTSPTGGGKSRIQFECAVRAISEGSGVVLFAHRKMLIEQVIKSLALHKIEHGVRAASHAACGYTTEPFQVASIQTEYSRVVVRRLLEPHHAGLVIVDEAHLNETPQAAAVYKEYLERGAVKVGFTATPLGIGGGYDELVVAGTTSELRDCGALVRADQFGCTEPDLRNIKRYQIGEDLSEPDNVKAIMAPGIHGRVLEWYRRLNPQGLPAIGFGPGVAEAFGFAEAFVAAGVPAAHIDGDRIWINGEWLPSTENSRAHLLAMSRTGQVRIVWNRFVLREAVDMPWLQHGILATVFGSLQSYLQSGGRLLRSCPPVGKTRVVVQDHGGNWWRHGSLNADRTWRLTDTSRIHAGLRNDRMTGAGGDGEPPEQEPFLCPACNGALVLRNLMRDFMVTCPRCGHEMDFRRRSRPVIQADGSLVEHPGPIWQRRRVDERPDTAKKWRTYYFRARNSTMTFNQAAGLFFHDNGYYPPRHLPLMPRTAYDWYLPVKSVPFARLVPEAKADRKEPDNA